MSSRTRGAVAVACAVLALLADCGAQSLADRERTTHTAAEAHAGCPRLPFQLSRNKVVLEAHIGEGKTAVLLLDSGMPSDGLFLYKPELQEAFGVANWSQAQIEGAGSGGAAPTAVADGVTFSIGPRTFTGQRVVVLRTDAFAGFPSDGVIGHSLFGHYAVEIDYDVLEITLHDPERCPRGEGWQRLPLSFKDNRIPWVEASVSVDGTADLAVSAYIDLASREALEMLLRPGVAYAVPQDAEDCYLGRGVSGDIHGKRARVARLTIGPYVLRDVVAAFTPAEVRSRQRDADAVLGNDAIRRFNVIFDYAGESLYLRPNSYHDDPFE